VSLVLFFERQAHIHSHASLGSRRADKADPLTAIDGNGNLLIADAGDNRIRLVNT